MAKLTMELAKQLVSEHEKAQHLIEHATAVSAAICIAPGKVSLELWEQFTWSLG